MRTLVGLLRVVGCLVGSGQGARAALAVLATDPDDRALARLAGDILRGLNAGVPLSAALAPCPAVPALVVEIIRRGEAQGELAPSLARAAAWLERTADARARLWTALFAPGRIAVPALLFALWMGVTVAPALRSIFDVMNLELAAMTKLSLGGLIFIGEYWPELLVLCGLGLALARRLAARYAGPTARLLARLPLVGRPWRAWTLAEFARALAWALQAGVALPDALVCAAAACRDPEYARCVAGALPLLRAGERAADALQPAPWDAGFSALLAEGEAMGNLPDLLALTGDVRDRMVGRDLERAAVRFELIALGALAAFTCVMLIAIIMPALPHHCCCVG